MIHYKLPKNKSIFSISLTLDDTDYIIDFSWNDRDSHYYIELKDSTNTMVCSQRRLVVNSRLFGGTPLLGMLFLYSQTGLYDPPLFGLYDDFWLIYYEESDLA